MNKLKKKDDSEKINNFIQNNENVQNENVQNENVQNENVQNENVQNENVQKVNNLEKKISVSSEKINNKKEIIFDIPVNITIELGRTKIKIRELLNFSKGSMLFLNTQKEEPLKIFANDKLVALGEIVMSENTYGVRIINIKNSLNTMN
ncbi:flagellar motor switch protein FliN [Buchnera aphidicola (Aphis craccivore)]|uniref:FliM/FliN family flagellar motor switch protein n=1 Tax=Buchnera aphidicola TaxID=9 RepID=UPI0015DE1EBF|nr:FliM/FliN family flagellar motor switch protein [Buchnera aphidicola]QLL40488.1 flagellar motor switch protein FliN [Buchnera aphidicola (Aphis craccivore)]